MFNDKKMLSSIISAIIVIVIAVGVTLGYRVYVKHNVEKGTKEITVNVVADTDDYDYSKTYTIETDEEFLGYALVNNLTLVTEGEEGNRYITGVDDVNADSSKQEWWKILINDQMGDFGMDDQPIKDGDVITIKLEVGYN
jgi:hypothetical protein